MCDITIVYTNDSIHGVCFPTVPLQLLNEQIICKLGFLVFTSPYKNRMHRNTKRTSIYRRAPFILFLMQNDVVGYNLLICIFEHAIFLTFILFA